MQAKCIACGVTHDVSDAGMTLTPLRIPFCGYWLDCPRCRHLTRHTILTSVEVDCGKQDDGRGQPVVAGEPVMGVCAAGGR